MAARSFKALSESRQSPTPIATFSRPGLLRLAAKPGLTGAGALPAFVVRCRPYPAGVAEYRRHRFVRKI